MTIEPSDAKFCSLYSYRKLAFSFKEVNLTCALNSSEMVHSVNLNDIIFKSLILVLRGESLVKEVIEGRMEGKKEKGTLCIILLDGIKNNETYERI